MNDNRPRITGLAHVTLKTADLPTTMAFYEQVLGLRAVARPPFPFPGAWLGFGDDALVHVVAGDRAREADGTMAQGTGVVDHVSFWARGYRAQCERLQDFGLPYCESCPPQTSLAQVFVLDPNRVLIELTYDLRNESGAIPGGRNDPLRWDAAHYARFAPAR